jgi:hypothetical protein
MRLTILAGLIMGAALAMQAALDAHAAAKIGLGTKAVRIQLPAIAPCYIAISDGPGAGRRASTHHAVG